MRARKSQQQFNTYSSDDMDDGQYDHNWTDRTYGGRGRYRGGSRGRSRGSRQGYGGYRDRSMPRPMPRQKKCYVCEKPSCWSTRHTDDERRQAFDKFRKYSQGMPNRQRPTVALFQSFLAEYEGVDGPYDNNDDITETEQLLAEMEIGGEDYDHFFTEYGEIDGA